MTSPGWMWGKCSGSPTIGSSWPIIRESRRDRAYLHHRGKPVVAVWGFGFNDGRKYTLAEGMKLVRFLKDDPKYGGNTVMLGVPTYWRTLDRDTVNDPKLHELILSADIVSPWTVGRYGHVPQAVSYAEKTLVPDLAWCKKHGKDYLPVVFPGFSWHNMFPTSPLNQIPRQGGRFLWAQYAAAKKAAPRWSIRRCSTRWTKARPSTNAPTIRRSARRSSSPTKDCPAIIT